EAGYGSRQVMSQSLQRPERRELARHARMHELEHLLGLLQVFEPVRAQISQARIRRQFLMQRIGGGAREQDLASMSSGQETGHTVEGRTKVVALPLLCGAGVQRHSHAQWTGFSPWLGPQELLSLKGGSGSGRCRGEHRTELISHCLEDGAAV